MHHKLQEHEKRLLPRKKMWGGRVDDMFDKIELCPVKRFARWSVPSLAGASTEVKALTAKTTALCYRKELIVRVTQRRGIVFL
jgi:hypothetical protein